MKKIKTDITYRLDHMPWTGFHTKFVLALGITWILDAFEVVLGGVLALLIVFIRFFIPESPRWLISKNRLDEASKIVEEIEKKYGIRN